MKGVTIADVLTALNDIRSKVARAEAGDAEHPHSRNRVMTLVAVAANEGDEQRALAACTAIAAHHPSLAIIVRDQPNVRGARIMDASIATGSHETSTGIHATFELVTLRVGHAAGEHLAALVDPLLLSGVPTYVWWLGTPPFGTRGLTDALKIAEAVLKTGDRVALTIDTDAPPNHVLSILGTVHVAPHNGVVRCQCAFASVQLSDQYLLRARSLP